MLPLINSGTFNTYQTIDWKVDWYPSSTGVPETGIGYRIGELKSSFSGASMAAAGDPAAYMESNSTPTISDDGVTWKYGRVTLLNDYWEAGAPLGISRARNCVLHWRGYLSDDLSWINQGGSGKFWLSFFGRGAIRVVHEGSTILNTTLKYDGILSTSLITAVAGDQFDIYYWQTNEAWGGLVGKYVPQKIITNTSEPGDEEFRDAPVLSASILPYSTATAVTLERVISASVEINDPLASPTLSFVVALSNDFDSFGWSILNNPIRLQHFDGTTTITLKRGQLIKFYGGFQNETYERFTGFIDNFAENEGKVTVSCLSIDQRLQKINVANYPDKLSYGTFAYLETNVSSGPVKDIRAYDNWPLEHAIKDLCYKSQIDSRSLFASYQYFDGSSIVDKYDSIKVTIAKDTFVDPNATNITDHESDTGASWLNGSTVTIQSNAAYSSSTSTITPILEIASGTANAAYFDYYRLTAVANFSAGSTSGQVKLAFRGIANSSFTGYKFGAERTSGTQVTLRFSRFSAGSQVATIYSTTGYSWNAGTAKKLIVEVRGDQFKLYIANSDGSNETLLSTQTDSNVSATNYHVGFTLVSQSGQSVTLDSFVQTLIKPLRILSSESIVGGQIKLPRNVKYGNAGAAFSPDRPNDDEYTYAPDASQPVGDFCKTLADGFAFDFRCNAQGNVVLAKRNNPDRYVPFTAGTSTYSPGAIQGSYQAHSGAFSDALQVWASRIDIVVGRSSSMGTITYNIKSADGTTTYATGTADLSLSGQTTPLLFYDNRFSLTGNNVCVFTLYSGAWRQYLVEISNNSGSAFIIDGLLLYHNDPENSSLPETLLTTKQIINLQTESVADDTRNHVVVIGKRKASITDSTKFKNPNNPENEFFVSAGVDVSSIYDADADNYFGTKDSVLIVDDSVADQDFADWVVQTILTRQRTPNPKATIEHTIIPVLEPRDVLNVSDEMFSTIVGSQTLWVTQISETYERDRATSKISTTSYPELSSYEPRHDLPLSVIDAEYAGRAAINVNVSYPSIDGGTITNPAPGLPRSYLVRVNQVSKSVSSDGNGEYLDMTGSAWPPIPDSIEIGEEMADDWFEQYGRIWKNNPYMKLIHVYDYTTHKIHLPFKTGAGTSNYTRTGGNGTSNVFASVSGSSVKVSYMGIDSSVSLANIYSGTSPFYDPYTSEIPGDNLVTVSFDALVSGYYRVSILGIKKGTSKTVTVAWLTESGQDPIEPEDHWTYYTSGGSKSLLWDGVDNIGDWNRLNSEGYAWVARGVFEQSQKPQIGKGFYVWNDQESPIVTISGQSSSGKLVFNDDHYSEFFVKIEVKADIFSDTTEPIRATRTDNLVTTDGQNPQSVIYIYTHLPPPNKIKIAEVEDWDPTQGKWDRNNPSEAGWLTSPDTAATIRNGKPLRLTLEAEPRPGTLFAADKSLTNVKVHRLVHLDVNIFDVFMLFSGKPWVTGVIEENKRVVARRLTNDEYAIDFADTEFRTGDSLDLSTGKWVFEPKDFLIKDEPLVYNDYLQIEDVPSFSINRETGEGRSRFIVGYMNYLFYLSVYTQDRSGRMVWAIDESFIDKTKILQNTFATTFPEDLENYFVRTILTRQWNDPDYRTDVATKWNISAGNQKFIQFYHDRLEFDDADAGAALYLDANGNAVNGALTTAYTDYYTSNTWSRWGSWTPPSYNSSRQLGSTSALNFFGDWTWEGESGGTESGSNINPYWIPCLSREFHPFYLVPPMPLQVNAWLLSFPYAQSHADEAVPVLWQGSTFSADWSTSDQAFSVGIDWESTITQDKNNAKNGSLDYTRQNEQRLWEHCRGMYCGSKSSKSGTGDISQEKGRSQVFSRPTSPYYINTMKYNSFVIGALDPDKRYNAGFNLKISAQISIGGFFDYNFLHQYNWYSASHFPVNYGTGELYTKYVNLKYSPSVALPAWLVYDAGAWAGWKPDGGTGSATLTWSATGGPKNSSTGDNIFSSFYKLPLYAVSTEPPEIKRVMMSLTLLNSRRFAPISGK